MPTAALIDLQDGAGKVLLLNFRRKT